MMTDLSVRGFTVPARACNPSRCGSVKAPSPKLPTSRKLRREIPSQEQLDGPPRILSIREMPVSRPGLPQLVVVQLFNGTTARRFGIFTSAALECYPNHSFARQIKLPRGPKPVGDPGKL